jgi:orotidine-5'-phosphate decarboxylase
MKNMKPETRRRILCALDTTDVDQASALVPALAPHVGGVKLGLEFFGACGPQGVARVTRAGTPVFLDLKLHDIPNTVAKAIRALVPLKPFMMTVHTSGGPEMLKAAAKAAQGAAAEHGVPRPLIVGVTILTSLNEDDLAAIGISGKVGPQVERLANLAEACGLDGVVCSPHEIATLRRSCGANFTLVVPGIRPAGADVGDQKRVMTPPEAVALGADYLVIGRPITEAADPASAAATIEASLCEIV